VVRRPLALALVLTASGVAWGQDRDPREADAQHACLTGDYQHGIDLLAQLYIVSDDVNYLYNQGRCLQQNGRFAEAIPRFREYLRKVKDPSPAEVADAEKQIAECRRLADPPPPAVQAQVLPPDDGARSRRIGGVLAVIGAVALVGAMAAGLAVQSFEKDEEQQFDPTRNLWGSRLEVLQWAGYGLGAISLGVGASFWVAGRPAGAMSGGLAWRARF
jgi:hypothetical protein